jgi:hypothetical protein
MVGKPLRLVLILCLAIGFVVAGKAHASDPGDVPTSAQEIRPLLIGAKVPDVSVRNADGADVALADVFRKEPTILIVYRGGW